MTSKIKCCITCKHFDTYPSVNQCEFGKLAGDFERPLPRADFIEKALLTCSNYSDKNEDETGHITQLYIETFDNKDVY
jgi:hypothetical protein